GPLEPCDDNLLDNLVVCGEQRWVRPSAQAIESLGGAAALGCRISAAAANELPAFRAIEHGVEDPGQRDRAPDLLLAEQHVGLPSATGDRQHLELFAGRKRPVAHDF